MENDQPAPKKDPVCPYCGGDPLLLAGSICELGGLPTMIFHCQEPACRKVLSVQLIPPQMVQRRSSLVVPGVRRGLN